MEECEQSELFFEGIKCFFTLITRELKKQKRQFTIEIKEMNKYQAHLLIPFLLEKQNYDEQEIKLLIK